MYCAWLCWCVPVWGRIAYNPCHCCWRAGGGGEGGGLALLHDNIEPGEWCEEKYNTYHKDTASQKSEGGMPMACARIDLGYAIESFSRLVY